MNVFPLYYLFKTLTLQHFPFSFNQPLDLNCTTCIVGNTSRPRKTQIELAVFSFSEANSISPEIITSLVTRYDLSAFHCFQFHPALRQKSLHRKIRKQLLKPLWVCACPSDIIIIIASKSVNFQWRFVSYQQTVVRMKVWFLEMSFLGSRQRRINGFLLEASSF